MTDRTPPKPASRDGEVSWLRYLSLFRRDIFASQPERLYGAKMAEFRTPFFRSFLLNEPELIKTVLNERPDDFPKSGRVSEGLRPLLGQSVFLTNGEKWKRQRRIIDPAFAGGRLRDTFPAMVKAGNAAISRLQDVADGRDIEIEAETSHMAADVIFRTLFSVPITDRVAGQVFREFRDYQRTQPLLNLAAFIPLPRWMPRFHRRRTKETARRIRALIAQMTNERAQAIKDGNAPDDLATKIMTTLDPENGQGFLPEEMVDQVAIFFLAGHETSASAMAWALYLLARYQDVQQRAAAEAESIVGENFSFSDVSRLTFIRDVFRETLRLYPPVPMMVRSNSCPETFRNRSVPPGSQIVLSPWHLQRNPRIWDRADDFDPDRWQSDSGKVCARSAYMPFSAGPRVCTGAGFAMVEGPLLLAQLLVAFQVRLADRPAPKPQAHLTVRSDHGIWLTLTPRAS